MGIFVEGKKWESTEENPDEQLEQMLDRLNLAVARTYSPCGVGATVHGRSRPCH